jgi:dienelactone hydrolase
MKRRHFVTSALLCAAAWPGQRAWAQKAPAYEVLDFEWTDPARQRPVPARLYWPDGASDRVPLVVFSHGIGGSRRGYSYLGKHWSSHGIASLHLQHAGSDNTVWFGNPFGLVGRLQDAAQEKEAVERPLDLRFALDQVLRSPLGERIDARRIVAAGHSYGANTTLLAAGAQVQRSGRVMDLQDPRLSAAIVLSAPPFYGEGDPQHILSPVKLPSLHITATGDVIRIPGYYSGADDRIAVFQAVGGSDKALAVYEGGSHSMFTDRPGTGGPELNPRVKMATQELTLTFLQSLGKPRTQRDLAPWVERHRSILARHDGLLPSGAA